MEEARRTLESKRRRHLTELNVAQEAIDESALQTELAPVNPATTFRVMQWNVLANGLSNDGFLVLPALKESHWPCTRDKVPTSQGNGAETFQALLGEMMLARGNKSALEALKAKYDTQEASQNLDAVIDSTVREQQMLLTVLAAGRPDIVVLEELDHYGSMAAGMVQLGYSSALPGTSSPYTPMHLTGYDTSSAEGVARFIEAIESRGHAFLPKPSSTAMHFSMKNLGMEEAFIAAARKLGLESQVVDSKSGGLSKKCFSKLPGGSGPLFQAIKDTMKMDADIDDDGVGIFWRADRFQAERLEVMMYPKSGSGALKVSLRDIQGSRQFSVVGTHLGSGDSRADEDERLSDQVDPPGGLSEWVATSRRKGEALVLCLDANSHPQMATPEGSSSVWCSLRAALGASVWDEYFDEAGQPRHSDPPVTTNKVRGPASGQAKKIGLHAYYCIDHIFYSAAHFSLQRHAIPVQRFPSPSVALETVLPSLRMPSDHYPVVVDICWGPALRCYPASFVNEMKALASQVESWTAAQVRQDALAADKSFGMTCSCVERLRDAAVLQYEICQQIHDLALCIAAVVLCSVFKHFDDPQQRNEDLECASTPTPREVSAALWWRTKELFRVSATKACREMLGQVDAAKDAQLEFERLEQALVGSLLD